MKDKEKTLARSYEPRAKYLEIGRKYDGCDCVIVAKTDNEIITELCDYHVKTVKDGSIKYISPCIEPAHPMTEFGEGK